MNKKLLLKEFNEAGTDGKYLLLSKVTLSSCPFCGQFPAFKISYFGRYRSSYLSIICVCGLKFQESLFDDSCLVSRYLEKLDLKEKWESRISTKEPVS